MAEETKPAFVVNGTTYPVPDDLTLGEMCDAERFFGVEFGTVATGASNVRLMTALLWIAVRRQDANVTIDDIRNLPPDVFTNAMADGVGPPAPAADASSGSSETSGADSRNGGGDPAAIPEPSGAPS
jgi:hypothetical protein